MFFFLYPPVLHSHITQLLKENSKLRSKIKKGSLIGGSLLIL